MDRHFFHPSSLTLPDQKKYYSKYLGYYSYIIDDVIGVITSYCLHNPLDSEIKKFFSYFEKRNPKTNITEEKLEFYLLDIDINMKYGNNKNTPLLFASQNCGCNIVKLLLQHGADPNIQDINGNTSLHIASSIDNYGIIQLLLEHKADPNIINGKGQTALMKILISDNKWNYYNFINKDNKDYHSVKILLEYKADPNIIDNNGYTVLHYALKSYDDEEIVKLLLEYKADPNFKYKNGELPIFDANLTSMRYLLQFHADPNSKDKYGMTILHYSTKHQDKAMVKLLLEHNANPNISNKHVDNGQSPLHVAILKADIAIIKLLMKHKADPNILDNLGVSPFQLATNNTIRNILKHKF